MERRELLKRIALVTGGIVVGGDFLLTGCTTGNKEKEYFFSEGDIDFLNEVAETILPKTKSPGAKDAEVGQFIKVMVSDCYTQPDQKIFHQGMTQLNRRSKDIYGSDFTKLSTGEQKKLLLLIDKEAKAYQQELRIFNNEQNEKEKKAIALGDKAFIKEQKPTHYFTMIKQLTLLGFFTSEPGETQALRYAAVPGRFESCVPYEKGDRAWVS